MTLLCSHTLKNFAAWFDMSLFRHQSERKFNEQHDVENLTSFTNNIKQLQKVSMVEKQMQVIQEYQVSNQGWNLNLEQYVQILGARVVNNLAFFRTNGPVSQKRYLSPLRVTAEGILKNSQSEIRFANLLPVSRAKLGPDIGPLIANF